MKKLGKILESKNCYIGINKNLPERGKKKNIRYRPIIIFQTKDPEEIQWLTQKYPGKIKTRIDKSVQIVYSVRYNTRSCEQIIKDAYGDVNEDVKHKLDKILELQKLKIKNYNTNIKQNIDAREEIYQSLKNKKQK